MTNVRKDPFWGELGLDVMTEAQLKDEQVRARINVNREAAVERRRLRMQAEDDWQWHIEHEERALGEDLPPTAADIDAANANNPHEPTSSGHIDVAAAAAAAYTAALRRAAPPSAAAQPSAAAVAAAVSAAVAAARDRVAAQPFKASSRFNGSVNGMVYRIGTDGLGYYPDVEAITAVSLQPELFPFDDVTPLRLSLLPFLPATTQQPEQTTGPALSDRRSHPPSAPTCTGPNPEAHAGRGSNATATWRRTVITPTGRSTTRCQSSRCSTEPMVTGRSTP